MYSKGQVCDDLRVEGLNHLLKKWSNLEDLHFVVFFEPFFSSACVCVCVCVNLS